MNSFKETQTYLEYCENAMRSKQNQFDIDYINTDLNTIQK